MVSRLKNFHTFLVYFFVTLALINGCIDNSVVINPTSNKDEKENTL